MEISSRFAERRMAISFARPSITCRSNSSASLNVLQFAVSCWPNSRLCISSICDVEVTRSERSAPIFDLPSSMSPVRLSLPCEKVVAISRARSTSVSLIWRARASSAVFSFCAPVSSASARVWNSLMSDWPRSASVLSISPSRKSNSCAKVCVWLPSTETIPEVRSSIMSDSERTATSVVSVSRAMRVSSRLANASPDVEMRSEMTSSRWSKASYMDEPLSLMRSTSASPACEIVSESCEEDFMILSRMISLAEPSSSRSASCAPEIEARTRSAWVTTASRSDPRPSTSARIRNSFSE